MSDPPHPITPNDPLAGIVLPDAATLGFAGLEILVSQRGSPLPGTMATVKALWISCIQGQAGKERCRYLGRKWSCCYTRGQEEDMWS